MSATALVAFIAACAVLAVVIQVINYRRLREYRGTQTNHHHSGTGHGAHLSGPPNAAIAAAAAFGTRPGEGADPRLDLPVEYRDDAILAWKTAYVVWHDGRWMFRALTREEYYGADERARCRERFEQCNSVGDVVATFYDESDHEVPDPACACGFYATAEPPPPSSVPHASFLLRVELTGRVIECEHGYRAQRQRVLGVVAPRCEWGWLQAEQCPSTATRLTPAYGGYAWPWCSEHAIAATGPPTPLDDVFAGLGVERHRGPDA